MAESSTEIKEPIVHLPVYYINEKKELEPLFIPHLPSNPQTWGKESVGGWVARLPANLPPGSIVFFITPENKPNEETQSQYPTYFCYRITYDEKNNRFIAEELNLRLEDYRQYIDLTDPKNQIYLESEEERFGRHLEMNIVGPKNNYSFNNMFENPFQQLIIFSPQIKCLVLTPQDEERIKAELIQGIK